MVFALDLREELQEINFEKIMKKIVITPFGGGIPKLLKQYLLFKEMFVKYCKQIVMEYTDNYMCNGGFGLNSNLYFLMKYGHNGAIASSLGYARYMRDNDLEKKIEKSELEFKKPLTNRQLYDLITTGSYRL